MAPTRPVLSSFFISSFPSDQESFLQLESQDHFPRKESEQKFGVGHLGVLEKRLLVAVELYSVL